MICVECGNSVPSLYTQYKNGYIKLTDCPKCHKTADKYIEFDNVLLFIDILLLKPQAYKHLVFNFSGADDDENTRLHLSYNVRKIRVISVLFEIYLTWAYKEKTMNGSPILTPYLIYNTIMEKSILEQYLFFAVKAYIEDIITHSVVHMFFLGSLQWRPKSWKKRPLTSSQYTYLKDCLSLTVLLSAGTKLFPILMLIWPYDNTYTTTIIRAISTVNLMESLRIITGKSAVLTTTIFLIIELLKFFITKATLILLLTRGDFLTMNKFVTSEYLAVLSALKGFQDYLTRWI